MEYKTILLNIGRRVEFIRNKQDISQTQLASLSKVNRSSIIRIESGEAKNMRIGTLQKIAKALKIKLSYLMSD